MDELYDRGYTISIHAAREGGDASTFSKTPVAGVFQSTPPVKAATSIKKRFYNKSVFQSTPPVKAATGVDSGRYRRDQNFNPRRP